MQSALEYNGAAVVAMTGKNCVAIARYVRSLGRRVSPRLRRARPHRRSTRIVGHAQRSAAAVWPPYRLARALAFAGPPHCSDTRLGIQGQTVATDFEKVFRMHDKLYVGLSGLATDVQTM
jgi:20S proteasome alpha/beta subunit